MNRNSPPSSSIQDEPDFHSTSRRSGDGLSSLDREESKSQSQKRGHQSTPGLYISLTSAQAYSIMRNIPKKFRLIEKTNVRKTTTKEKNKTAQTPRQSKKKEIV
jgi:hypothetical protein